MDTADGKFKVWAHQALGKRSYQEDSFAIQSANGRTLVAVADGMGGYGSGDVASMAVLKGMQSHATELEEMAALATDIEPSNPDIDGPWPLLTQSQRQVLMHHLVACIDVGLVAMRETNEANLNRNMGTTLTAIWTHGMEVAWAQVGDSRLYRLPVGSDVAIQITEDQSHPYPNENVLTRALSANPDRPQLTWGRDSLGIFEIKRGDILILCTDGVSGPLDPNVPRAKRAGWSHIDLEPGRYMGLIVRSGSLAEAAQRLVDTAINLGGTDNATAIVVEVQ